MQSVSFIFALFLAGLAGCQLYDPALIEIREQCLSRRPPERPIASDAESLEEVIFALRDLQLEQGEGAWREIGLDLDGICTQEPDYQRECEPVQEGDRPPVDGVDGIDNIFGEQFYPLVALAVPELGDQAREAQSLGRGMPVLRLRGWNGTGDDPRVRVSLVQSVFSIPANEDGSYPEVHVQDTMPHVGDSVPALPRWDGNDQVWLRSDSFVAGNPELPLVYNDNAYVADGTLVVSIPDGVQVVSPADESGVVVRFTDGWIIARFSEDYSFLEQVIVAGRWSLVDILNTAETVGLCYGSTQHKILESRLRRMADVRSRESAAAAGLTCDALSVAVSFRGTRVTWGEITEGPAIPNLCSVPQDPVPPDFGAPSATPAANADTDGGAEGAGEMEADAGVPMRPDAASMSARDIGDASLGAQGVSDAGTVPSDAQPN